MIRWLRVFAVLLEDWSWVLSTQIHWLTTTYNPKGSPTPSFSLCMECHTESDVHIFKIKLRQAKKASDYVKVRAHRTYERASLLERDKNTHKPDQGNSCRNLKICTASFTE